MTFLVEHCATDGFSQISEGTRSSSCIWWERAHSQIVVWCGMARVSNASESRRSCEALG